MAEIPSLLIWVDLAIVSNRLFLTAMGLSTKSFYFPVR